MNLRLISIAQAAEMLGVGRSTAYRLAKAGKIPCVRGLGPLRVHYQKLVEMIEAGIPATLDDFTIHDLRHTCAAWLVTAGVPMMEIRDLLGHSTVQMTEKYAHLAPARVRDAVSVLDKPMSQSRYTENPVGRVGGTLKLVTA